ncbi:hypothetical protein BTS2_1344 [Bacillus sp. TS-2]|nr:hypothetical protein BTS2_1344 [Bacillus sp. TS-2]
MKRFQNKIAKFLFWSGCILTILSIVITSIQTYTEYQLYYSDDFYYDDDRFIQLLNHFITYIRFNHNQFLFSLFLIGFAEIIEIFSKRNHINNSMNETDEISITTEANEIQALTTEQKTQVVTFFEQLGLDVDEIIPSPFEGFLIVQIHDDFHLVEMGEFQPKILKINNYPEIAEWFYQQNPKHK